MARSDPSASPSGFSWVVTTKRSCFSIAFAVAFISSVVVELIEKLGKPRRTLCRPIVLKDKPRSALEVQLPVDLLLQDAVRALERGEASLAAPLRAEHAHVHGSVARDRDWRVPP